MSEVAALERVKSSHREKGRRPSSPGPLDSSQLEVWTGFLLHRVSSIARDLYSRRTEEVDLRPSQVGILQLLQGGGPMVQARIAEALGVDKPAMVALLDGLERRELVKRAPHRDDGRAILVHLSAQGGTLLNRVQELNKDATEKLFVALSPDERSALHNLLLKVYRSHDTK